MRCRGWSAWPDAITMLQPAASAIFPASILVIMPPEPRPETGLPAIASISGVISLDFGDELGARRAGRRGVEPVDVGQQHQAVGRHHRGDARGEPVIVAIADLGGRDRIVLVDDGHRALRRAASTSVERALR